MDGASCTSAGMVLGGVGDHVDIGDWEWGGTAG
eukprot:CAMPEP_0172636028 /NCGR_PEP_ID=MMETSP1068-20121228/202103_1 /TAXON_ID=35684 /ORGANISM="Pseudopedinella elastica, Strain CCMP716" /LENGTH=32 /DNA_ID= /DNA_START= /DNA_END= /DNA_ORIENTATION=